MLAINTRINIVMGEKNASMFTCFVISNKCEKSIHTYGSFANAQDDNIVFIYILQTLRYAITNYFKISRSCKNKQ